MTIIHPVDNLEAAWPDLWPLFRQFEEHHAKLHGGRLRPGRELTVLKRLQQTFAESSSLLLVAEDRGRTVGMGMGRIGRRSFEPTARMGYLNNFFIEPASRGAFLVQRLHREIEDWLRSKDVRQAERSVLTANQRTLRLWRHLGYEPTSELLRKTLPAPVDTGPAIAGLAVSLVADVDQAWPKLWPLIQKQEAPSDGRRVDATPNREDAQRARLLKLAAANRVRILLAEVDGRPAGIVSARLIKNPWIIEERAGVISDFYVEAQSGAPEVGQRLLTEIEAWLTRKDAGSVQHATPLDEAASWRQRGYQPYFTTLRKDL